MEKLLGVFDMAVYAQNFLIQVQEYLKSSLGIFQNKNCLVSTANTEFTNFNNIQGNLGSSVTFDSFPNFTTSAGLVAVWQPLNQILHTLTVDQANNTSISYTNQERIFNVEKETDNYIKKAGLAAMASLASTVESNIAQNFHSAVASQLSTNLGQLNTASGPYRFFGDGVTQLTSYQQLAQAIMYTTNYGVDTHKIKAYLPDTIIPTIVGNGLNQFAPRRNDDISYSWEIGDFGTPLVNYYQSNLLPIHVSGSVGVNANTLTVVSVNDPSGQNVTQLTVTTNGSANDPNAVFSGDLFNFIATSGFANAMYLVNLGTAPSASPVQIRATASAGAVGGTIVINFFPALNWAGGSSKNINTPIQAGMRLQSPTSHKCGCVVTGDGLFLAMPRLPIQDPYSTASEYDEATGVGLRLTYGSVFGQNQQGYIYDEVHGSFLVPNNSLRLLIPLSQ